MSQPKSKKRPGRIGLDRVVPQKDAAAATEPFPPLSTSLEFFLKAGSDREFRNLIYDLFSLSNMLSRISKHFSAYIGVSGAQQVMIQMIAETHGMTVGRIAKQLDVTSQFVTIEIGDLIKKNVVQKRANEADRRSMLLELTPKGRSLLRELGPLRRRTNDTMFRSLTEDKAMILKEIIRAVISDTRSALHELEAPDLRANKTPSSQRNSSP
jgi:MarR family transcriptional regulator, organic hydroperoxide resistance regulator